MFPLVLHIDRYFLAVVAAVIVVSALPTLIHMAGEYGPTLRHRFNGGPGGRWTKLDPDASPD